MFGNKFPFMHIYLVSINKFSIVRMNFFALNISFLIFLWLQFIFIYYTTVRIVKIPF